MKIEISSAIKNFCAEVGSDTLLTQGPGGNFSVKSNGTLLIKASGHWLRDANKKNIFVNIDLSKILIKFKQGNFNYLPKPLLDSELKPSIETSFHAILPQNMVLHLHSIPELSVLVQKDSRKYIKSLMPKDLNYHYINYTKPGSSLAKKIWQKITKYGASEIIFLENHGIIICGKDIKDLKNLIKKLKSIFLLPKTLIKPKDSYIEISKIPTGFKIYENNLCNHLIQRDDFFFIIKNYWALYPDHIVFLGPKAEIHSKIDSPTLNKNILNTSKFIFLKSGSVLCYNEISEVEIEQMTCYLEVISRIPPDREIRKLTQKEVLELLNWDAETHRKSINLK